MPGPPPQAKHRHTEPAQAHLLLPTAQMIIRLSSAMILQTSSGSIRNVSSLSNVTRPGVAPIVASTVRPISVPDGTVMVMYGTYDAFVLARSARAVERVVGIG